MAHHERPSKADIIMTAQARAWLMAAAELHTYASLLTRDEITVAVSAGGTVTIEETAR